MGRRRQPLRIIRLSGGWSNQIGSYIKGFKFAYGTNRSVAYIGGRRIRTAHYSNIITLITHAQNAALLCVQWILEWHGVYVISGVMLLLLLLSCCVVRLQVLVVAEKSRHFVTQQHAFHHLASFSALPVHSHFRAAWYAAVRRRVSGLHDRRYTITLCLK